MKWRHLAITAAWIMLGAAGLPTADAADQDAGSAAAASAASGETAAGQPAVALPEMKFEFDPVVDGTEINHAFLIRNTGTAPLAILQVKTG